MNERLFRVLTCCALLFFMAGQAFGKTRAAGQDRIVTFWLNFEAPSSAPWQMGMHELKVDKRTLGYDDLKLMGESHGNFIANMGGVYYDGTFYCTEGTEMYGYFSYEVFHFREADNWKLYAQYYPGNPGFSADMVTLNPVTKKAYGNFVTTNGEYDFEFCEMDYQRLERKTIAKSVHRYCAMAFDRRGRWLGISNMGDLYEIDTTTGLETLIGSTGLPVSSKEGAAFYNQTGCYDPSTDTFYWGRTDLEGKSAIYAVDPTTAKAELYADLPNYTLIAYMTVHDSYNTTAAPAAVSGLQATTTGDGKEATIAFTLPSATIAGGAVSGQLNYDIVIDGTVQKQGSAAAGAAVSEKLTLTAGHHRVDVVPSNAAGDGLLAFTPLTVGYDSPDIPGYADLLVEKTKATLSWEAATGEYGGNVGNVTYNVTRYPDNKVVATGLTATNYVDETIPSGAIVRYTYGITPVNSTGAGREKKTNAQVGGSALQVPYYIKARSDVEEQDFSFIDANRDGITWEVSDLWDFISFSQWSYATRSNTAQWSDDWLFLPAITLQAGKQYQVEFDERGSSGYDVSEKMEVTIGQLMKPESQTRSIISSYEIPKNEPQHRISNPFTVEADGDYYIGFHVAGANASPANSVELRTIAVVQTPAQGAPDAVTSLTVSPGAKGAYNAVVGFTTPSVTSNIRIYRNNTLIHTIDNAPANQPQTYTDNGLTSSDNGVNQYVVVAANGNGDGEVAVAEAFVGVDMPTVDGITGSVEEKNGTLAFTWTPASSIGAKKGYVNPDGVTYYIYETRGARNYPLGHVTGQTTFTYEGFNVNEGTQQLMKFSLGTANEAGYLENAIVNLGSHVVGEPYRLPFSESLEGGNDSKYFFWNETNNDSRKLTVATDDSFDDDGGCYQWSGGAEGNYYSVNLGKVSLRGASRPALLFAYKFASDNGCGITVKVKTPDGKVHELQSLATSTANAGKWQVAKVSLNDYIDETYVMPMIEMQSNRATALVNIDAISVADMPNYNLAVQMKAASQLKAGVPNDVDIVVRNVGNNDMSDFKVKLFEGDREVFSQDVETELSTLQRKNIRVDSYVPSVFNAGKRVTLRAEVSASRDNTTDDNTYELEVDVLDSESPQPSNLQGEETVNGLTLTWKAPEALDATVTEDFEGNAFTDFSTGGIEQNVKNGELGGGWTLFDGDNTKVDMIDGMEFAEGSEVTRSAWVVFNTSKNINSGITPHSGQKFAVALTASVGYSYDWLISPLMNQQAQTISFFANEPAGFDSHTAFQVLASSTDTSVGSGKSAGYGTTTGSFTVVGEYKTSGNGWEKFEASLPEGTKYFAIRNTSQVKTGRFLCVDDITYHVGSGSVAGYNVYVDGKLAATVSGAVFTYTLNQTGTDNVALTAVYEGNRESAPVYLDGTSGISTVRIDATAADRTYNLQGQRVTKPVRKGVYVIDGKKVVIK